MLSRGDAADIARVLRDSFAEFRESYTEKGFAATTPGETIVRQRMEEGPTWIALLGEDIVATVSAMPEGKTSVYVRSMAVTLASARIGYC